MSCHIRGSDAINLESVRYWIAVPFLDKSMALVEKWPPYFVVLDIIGNC